MKTNVWTIDQATEQNKKRLKEAAEALQQGELVAFPTETVYGLGADATQETAVREIFRAKGRPQDNPLIIHVASKAQLYEYVENVPAYVDTLIDVFTPGPLTFILKDKGLCAKGVTAGLETIAIRIPQHPVARELIDYTNRPLAAPSANISGKPSPTTAQFVEEDLAGRIYGIVDGGQTGIGLESTILDCTTETPTILRPGGVTGKMIEEATGLSVQEQKPMNEDSKAHPKAPGMKYRHYAPSVPLIIATGNLEETIKSEQATGKRVGVMARENSLQALDVQPAVTFSLGDTLADVANRMYYGLRYFNASNCDVIISEAFSEEGIGLAIMNRLKKAATSIQA